MHKLFPFLQWRHQYQKSFLTKDIVAGLTVGIVLIPQGMAYAMVAGLPPVYGLYAALVPVLFYALLGTSRQLAVGPVAMDSLLVAAGLGTLAITSVENYISLAIFLAFLVGAIQLLLGVFRMGFLVNFMSKPVISGFTSGAAFIIIFSQLKHLLGTAIPGSSQFHKLVSNAFKNILNTHWVDLLVGVIAIILIVAIKRWSKRIPGILVVVVLGIIAAFAFHLEQYGLKVVGEIPKGLPSFQLPDISMGNIETLWPIALTLALVGYLEAISIGKSIQENTNEDTINPNQELIALGTANMAGSFFQGYPVTASFSRSAISYQTGAKSTIASLFSVGLVALTLLFLTPIFYYLPNAVLAAIIMVSVFNLIDFKFAKELWENRKDEFLVWVLTFLLTLFIGIKEGILIGVLFALLVMVYRTSKPHYAVLGQVKGTDYYKNVNRFNKDVMVRDDVLIIRFDAQLYFGNTTFFKKQIEQQVAKKGSDLKAIILNAEAINYIDSTAATMLKQLIEKLQQKGIEFFIAGAIGPARDIIFSSGIITILGKEHLFVKTHEVMDYINKVENVNLKTSEKIACQNQHASKK